MRKVIESADEAVKDITDGATIMLGAKDLKLLLEAAETNKVWLTVADLMQDRFDEAIASGLGNTDWAAGLLTAAEQAAHQ